MVQLAIVFIPVSSLCTTDQVVSPTGKPTIPGDVRGSIGTEEKNQIQYCLGKNTEGVRISKTLNISGMLFELKLDCFNHLLFKVLIFSALLIHF